MHALVGGQDTDREDLLCKSSESPEYISGTSAAFSGNTSRTPALMQVGAVIPSGWRLHRASRLEGCASLAQGSEHHSRDISWTRVTCQRVECHRRLGSDALLARCATTASVSRSVDTTLPKKLRSSFSRATMAS